jgi:uncharacterized membrane protein YdjX (TVP38/TMEM64 family)
MKTATRAFFLQATFFALLLGAVIGAGRFLDAGEWAVAAQEELAGWGVWAWALFPLLYALFNVLLLPGGILSFGGGLLFGFWWGFVIVLAGTVLGSMTAFLISRAVARDWIKRKIDRHPRWRQLDAAVEEQGWRVILLSQLNPLLPTSLISYVYGTTGIPFWTCALWVTIGKAPGVMLYVYLGSIGNYTLRQAAGNGEANMLDYGMWIAGLVLALILMAYLSRLSAKALPEEQP